MATRNKPAAGWVRILRLTPPTLDDNTADADRLTGALKSALKTDAVLLDLELLKALPDLLRASDFQVRCTLFRESGLWRVVAVADPSATGPPAGLAVDLGTSRVVLRLLDLTHGQTMAEIALDNPQIAVGPDVLARIHSADTKEGRERLNRLIIDGLNQKIGELCSGCGLSTNDVHLMAVAGNTAMTHLFLGLDPRWIIREPYIPAVNRPGLLKAAELGIEINPSARVKVFPNIGSYFGGDLIAGILYSGLDRSPETAILVDVGTNAEVVLGNENWLIACAGAAGPALEGGVTKMGMMAGPGVIDTVVIDSETGELTFHTIEEKPPVGICGSGLIDLAAQLFLAGMVDIRGKLVPDRCGGRFCKKDDLAAFEIVAKERSGTGSALTVGQADLDSLVRSKAAMFTILETITETVGITPDDLGAFHVAGTFGSFIKPKSAITVGMLPDLPLERYRGLGNSSLGGATMVLTDPACIEGIDRIRDRITYLELNVNQAFMNRFSAAKFLPHTDRGRFPSVRHFK